MSSDQDAGRDPRMSGAILLEHRRILEEKLGADRFARLVDELAPTHRAAYTALSPMSFLDIATAEAVMVAAAHELGRDVADLHVEVSRLAVERTLKTVWRLLLRLTSDEALVSRTPRIYARTFDKGQLVATIPAPGAATIRIEGWPDPPEFSLRGLRTGIATVLELAGRKNVQVRSVRGTSAPEFSATWKP